MLSAWARGNSSREISRPSARRVVDADGLSNVQYDYQWLADDAVISGATGLTYTLSDVDGDKTVRVRVSFTDDAGNDETLTSGEVGPVLNPPRCDVVPDQDQAVKLRVSRYSDDYVDLAWEVPSNLGITHEVLQRCEQDGEEFVSSGSDWRFESDLYFPATGAGANVMWGDDSVEPDTLYKYTLLLRDESDSIVIEQAVTVHTPPLPDGTGATDATLSALTLSSVEFGPTEKAFIAGPFESDAVSYIGNASSGVTETTVSPTLKHAGASYVIKLNGVVDGDRVVPLGGGDNVITVVVTAEDDTTTRTYTITVTRSANTPATGAPTISGTVQAGETLTADKSGITDEDGLTRATFSYQWLSSRDTEIQGATSFTYTLVAADEGKTIKVQVSFTDDAGNEETLTSAATAAVAAAPTPNSPATGAPTISGTAQVGEALTAATSGIADEDGLTNVTFSYQWQADGADISGATDDTYTLVVDDMGKAISVAVSFTDDRGHGEELASAATAAVEAAPLPPLTASLENVATSHDGESAFTFELRFSEEFSLSYKTLRDHAFTVTGGTVRKAQRLEQRSNVGWRITVRPDGNGQVAVVLPETTDCDDQGAISAPGTGGSCPTGWN